MGDDDDDDDHGDEFSGFSEWRRIFSSIECRRWRSDGGGVGDEVDVAGLARRMHDACLRIMRHCGLLATHA